MFGDMHLILAWFGFIFLMLLFKVPFLVTSNKSHPAQRVHSARLLPSELWPPRIGRAGAAHKG